MTTAEPLEEVRRAARQRYHLYTAPALNHAAALLADLYEAGERHGISRSKWNMVTSLATAAVDVIDPWSDDVPQDHDGIVRELDLLVDALRSGPQPMAAERINHRVRVPRTSDTPPWGFGGQADLAVAIGRNGWDFLPFVDEGQAPAVFVTGPFGPAGAAAIADLVHEVLAGQHGDPFRNH